MAVGSGRHVAQAFEGRVVTTQEELERQYLRLAPKSVVTCTGAADAKLVDKRLRSRGVDVQWGCQTKCLGVDLSKGKRLARQARAPRMKS
eukprot:7270220-Pyramimonas_sp.AAC.1